MIDKALDLAGRYPFQLFALAATALMLWQIARAGSGLVLAVTVAAALLAIIPFGYVDVVNAVGMAAMLNLLRIVGLDWLGGSGGGATAAPGGTNVGHRPSVPFNAPAGFNPYEQDQGAHAHGYEPTRDPGSERYRS